MSKYAELIRRLRTPDYWRGGTHMAGDTAESNAPFDAADAIEELELAATNLEAEAAELAAERGRR